MDGYEQELHIGDELFESMREDADRVLQKLLKNMVEKDSLEGKVTISIDVALYQEFVPNRALDIPGETRRVLTPKFSHKVGSVMQIKNEAKGDRNCDGSELVWDSVRGEYVLVPIANTDQMTIFDSDFRCVNNPEDADESTGEGQRALEGGSVASLPGPVESEKAAGNDENDPEDDMSGEFGYDGSLPFGEDYDDGYGYEEPDDGSEEW